MEYKIAKDREENIIHLRAKNSGLKIILGAFDFCIFFPSLTFVCSKAMLAMKRYFG